jgi:hypothetical protein
MRQAPLNIIRFVCVEKFKVALESMDPVWSPQQMVDSQVTEV